jgi:hypothetical protein
MKSGFQMGRMESLGGSTIQNPSKRSPQRSPTFPETTLSSIPATTPWVTPRGSPLGRRSFPGYPWVSPEVPPGIPQGLPRGYPGGTPITFIIVPAVNNRSAPGQKHGHRGKPLFFHQIIFGKTNPSYTKSNIILPGCGVLGCSSLGVPGRYFWAFVGGPGRNDYHPSEGL